MTTELANRLYIWWLIGIREQCKVVWDFPQEHLAIVRRRCDYVVVEWIPVRVQHSCRMPSEQRYRVRKLALLFQRHYCKCASTARLPVDCDIFWIGFDDVAIPCILADPEIIVALLSSSRATEDVSYITLSAHCPSCQYSTAE